MRRLILLALLLLLPAMVSALSVTLTWNANETPTVFRIYRQRSCTGSVAALVDVAGWLQTFTDTTVTPGTLYCYTVSEVMGNGEEGQKSPVAKVWTPAEPGRPGQPVITINP